MDTEIDAPEIDVVEAGEIDIEVSDPTDGGQVEDIDDVEDVPAPSVLDLDEYGDFVVTLKSGDEEELVPIRELRDRGMRQADYTRKTQALAEREAELEQAAILNRALQTNRTETIRWLAQQNGMTLAEAKAEVEASDWYEDPYETEPVGRGASDPVLQRLEALERVEYQKQADEQLRTTFAALQKKYGDDFNPQEVAQAAVSRNMFDPSMLELVYRDLAFDRIQGRNDATRQADC